MNYQFKNNSLEYCALHDVIDRYYAPLFGEADVDHSDWKGPVRAQLEFLALASRRARATIELSGQLATCTNPVSVMNAYSNYWRAAFNDCAESTKRMASMLSLQPEGSGAAWQGGPTPKKPEENAYKSYSQEPVFQNGSYAPQAERLRAS